MRREALERIEGLAPLHGEKRRPSSPAPSRIRVTGAYRHGYTHAARNGASHTSPDIFYPRFGRSEVMKQKTEKLDNRLAPLSIEMPKPASALLDLFARMDRPTLIVGKDLRLIWFNAHAADLGLKPAVLGSRLQELPLISPAIVRAVSESFRKDSGVEDEFLDPRGRWFRLCAQPCPTTDERRGAVLVMLLEIDNAKRSEAESSVTGKVLAAFSGHSGVRSILTAVLRSGCEVAGWDFGAAWIPSANRSAIESCATWHRNAKSLGKFTLVCAGRKHRSGVGLAGRVWSEKKTIKVPDPIRNGKLLPKDLAEKFGLVSAVGVPLLSGQKVVAVLEFFRCRPGPEDERLLHTFTRALKPLGKLLERKRAEEAGQQHLPVLEALPTGVAIVRAEDDVIVWTNPRIESLFDYGPGQMNGKRASILTDAGGEHAATNPTSTFLARLKRDGEATAELLPRKKGGGHFPSRVRGAAMSHPVHGPAWVLMFDPIREQGNANINTGQQEGDVEKSIQDLVNSLKTTKDALAAATSRRTRAEAVLNDEANLLFGIMEIQDEIANSGRDFRSVLSLVAHQTEKLTRAEGATIDMLEADHLTRIVATGLAAATVGLVLGLRTSLSGECIRSGGVTRCDDAETDPRVDWTVTAKAGLRSMLAVPLLRNKTPVGVLKVLSTRQGAFTERDVRTLEFMSAVVRHAMSRNSEIAAEQALMEERSRRVAALESQRRRQSAIAEFGRRALASGDMQLLLNDAVKVVREVLSIEFSQLYERDSETPTLVLRATAGTDSATFAKASLPADGQSAIGSTYHTRSSVLVGDSRTDHRFSLPSHLRDAGAISSISVLIGSRGEPFGVLTAESTKPQIFDDDDVHFLETLASVVGVALERRQMEDEMLAIPEREQQRIGQELHDGPCQELAGIQYKMACIAKMVASDPAAKAEIQKLQTVVQQAMVKARSLARGLLPAELQSDDLVSALNTLATKTAEFFSIPCTVRSRDSIQIANKTTATHLYRIAQEAVHNSIKHGRPRSITIEIGKSAEETRLVITDNGTGLPPDPGEGRGMGLKLMRHRAEMIGATLVVASADGGGTSVTCVLKPHE